MQRKLILRYVQNHYNTDVGTENNVFFIKYKILRQLYTYVILLQELPEEMVQEM